MDSQEIRRFIRDVPDYPKKGVMFRDITPLLGDPNAFSAAIGGIAALIPKSTDVVVGIESRGFILGAAAADKLGLAFVPMRKRGKLPRATAWEEYSLEYGTAAIEMHTDALEAHSNAAIVDDVLATGGTARAAARLVEKTGGTVTSLVFLMELRQLGGRRALDGYAVEALLEY